MTMKLQLAIFGFLCCVISMAHSESIQFEDCSAPGYKVKSAEISSCPELPCKFPSGSNMTMKVIYEVGNNVTACQDSLKTKLLIYPKRIEILTEPFKRLGLASVGSLADKLISSTISGIFNTDGIVAIPYPIPDSNSCHFLTRSCPICPGQTTEFNQTFEIYSYYPKITAAVKMLKVDKTGKTIFCLKSLAAIV